MVYFNYVAHHSSDSRQWKWGSCGLPEALIDFLFFFFFFFLPLNSLLHSVSTYKEQYCWLCVHSAFRTAAPLCSDCGAVRSTTFAAPPPPPHCAAFNCLLVVGSLPLRSVCQRPLRPSLLRDLPLHQQRHLQPHRRLLPVLPRLDRGGLFPRCVCRRRAATTPPASCRPCRSCRSCRSRSTCRTHQSFPTASRRSLRGLLRSR